MKVIVCVFLILGFVVSCQCQCSYESPCQLQGGDPLRQPDQFISENGSLKLDLVLDIDDFQIDWMVLPRRMFNNRIPSQTWRIRKGDHVEVSLINRLSEPEKKLPINELRLPNTTNIHTHGLHIGSAEPGDDVFVMANPNGNFNYSYDINPENPSGTYWYHPHVHGSTNLQVNSGMAGMIIVEDPTDSTVPDYLKNVSCPDNCQHDIQLVIQPTLFYTGGGFINLQIDSEDRVGFDIYDIMTDVNNQTFGEWLTNTSNNINYFTVNGQLKPVLTMEAGQMKRFRMVNAGSSSTVLAPEIVNEGGTDPACEVREIAFDGVYLDAPRPPKLGKGFIVASGRTDWLVVCNEPGIYQLKSTAPPVNTDGSLGVAEPYEEILVTLNVTGTTSNTSIPTSNLPERPWFVGDLRNVPQDELFGRFVVEANSELTMNRDSFSDQSFFRYKIESNKTQEWYLTNAGTDVAHPIHIHINSFQVISYNNYTGPFLSYNNDGDWRLFNQENDTCLYQHSNYNESAIIDIPDDPLKFLGDDQKWLNISAPGTLGYAQAGDWRDVLWVPPLSNITIRFVPHEYTGTVVIHCHILFHEDVGMMMVMEIVEQGESLEGANVTSGNAFPSSCMADDRFPFNNPQTIGYEYPLETTTSYVNMTNFNTTVAVTETVTEASTTSGAVVVAVTNLMTFIEIFVLMIGIFL